MAVPPRSPPSELCSGPQRAEHSGTELLLEGPEGFLEEVRSEQVPKGLVGAVRPKREE